ncbi:hypothetical protein AZE42_08507 [Rhizopogon vesiculosus]|uniref:Uncharacterized protein n=1 Tax=Rhizopogon vesiculosus TaxID=180088 RepID=A0A1J8Q5F0_9AGAM|nr:hypothetical protein AZE42_08507 [Rhizopogon vesiculosus]
MRNTKNFNNARNIPTTKTGSNRVWDLDTGQQVGKPLLGHDEEVLAVAASPDGKWIVGGANNEKILLWKVATRSNKAPVSFKGHTDVVGSIVFAPDSETFASASLDETVQVWRRKTGKTVLEPLKVDSEAHSVSYSPKGNKLAAPQSPSLRCYS